MRHPRTRSLAGALLSAAAFASATAGFAVPAFADTAPELGLTLPDTLVLAAGERDTVSGVLTLSPAPSDPLTLNDVEVVVDVRALAGIAEVAADGDGGECREDGSVVVCPLGDVAVDGGEADLALFRLDGLAGAVPGVSVDVPVGVRAEGRDAVTETVTVTAAGAVTLSAGDGTPGDVAVPVGGAATVPVSVANTGGTSADGAALVLRTGDGLWIPGAAGNCRFNAALVTCRFARELAPGRRFELSAGVPFAARSTAEAPGRSRIEYRWYTLDAYDTQVAPGLPKDLREGSGADATLVERTDARPARGADPASRKDSGTFDVRVTGDNPVDFAAVGAGLSGAVGSTGKLTVGVRNAGGADVPEGDGGPRVQVAVTLPPGLSAVDVPAGCSAGDGVFLCSVSGAFTPGRLHAWTFTVRVDELVLDAEGGVAVRDLLGADHNGDNDRAEILANATENANAEPAAPAPKRTRPAAASLAVTGIQLKLLALGGGLALLAGTSLFVLTRRRRALASRY